MLIKKVNSLFPIKFFVVVIVIIQALCLGINFFHNIDNYNIIVKNKFYLHIWIS